MCDTSANFHIHPRGWADDDASASTWETPELAPWATREPTMEIFLNPGVSGHHVAPPSHDHRMVATLFLLDWALTLMHI